MPPFSSSGYLAFWPAILTSGVFANDDMRLQDSLNIIKGEGHLPIK
jgi:hypothetical protein